MTFQSDDTGSTGLMTVNGNWPTLTGNLTIQVGANGNPGALELTGNIGDGGDGYSLTKTGGNTLILDGNNSFSGGLTVSQGTIAASTFNNANTNGPLGNNSSVTLGSSGNTGTLEYTGTGATASSNMPLTLASGGTGGIQVDNAGTDLTLTGAITGSGGLAKFGAGTLTIGDNYGFTGPVNIAAGTLVLDPTNLTISNNISGNGALVKDGSGTLNLTGNNNGLSGNLTIAGGSLVTHGDANLNNGTLTISSGGDWVSSGGSGHSIIANGGTWSPQGDFFFNGTITGGGGLTINSGDLLPAPASPTDIGTITIDATGGFTRVLTFYNNNFIANNTVNVVNGGNLDIGSGGSLTLTNTMSFASGTSFGERGTAVTVDTSNVTFPSAGMMTFQNDDTGNGAPMLVTGNWPTLTGNLTLQVGTGGNPGTLELQGVMSDGGAGYGLTKTGPNELILTGANTFSGNTTISGGSIELNNPLALQYSTVSTSVTNGLTFASTGSYTIGGLTGAGNEDIPNGVTLIVGNNSTLATNDIYSGQLSDSGSLTKIGAGTLTLTGYNGGFSGPISIQGGTLATYNYYGGASLGSGSNLVTISNGATWQPTGNASYSQNFVLGTGGGVFNAALNPGWDIFQSGTITGGTGLTVTNGDFLEAPGSENNLGTLTINGGRVLIVGGGDNFLGYTGGAYAPATVFVNSGGNLDFGQGGTETPSNTMTFASGSYLGERNGTSLVLGSNVTLPSSGTFGIQADDTNTNNLITINGNWPLTGNLALTLGSAGNTNGNVMVNGLISGSGGLTVNDANTVSGTNTLILNNANTFTGATTINSGFVQLDNFLALQNSTVSIGTPNGLTFANSGAYTIGGLAGASNEALTNVTTLNVGNDSTLATNNTYSGVLSGSAAYTEVGLGTQTLSGQNTYTGATTVSGGTLIAGTDSPNGGPGAFGNASSPITLGDAGTTANNWSPSLMIGGAFTIDRAITIANQATTGTYTIGGSTDSNAVFAGLITLDHSLTISQVANAGSNALSINGGILAGINSTETVTFSGPGNIHVGGAAIGDGAGTVAVGVSGGTVTFSGANTYSGGTSVSAGILNVNNTSGSGTGSGSVSISGTGTLAGSGSIAGAVSIGDGTINPGAINGTSILSINSLTMDGSANFAVNIAAGASSGPIAGTNYDSVYITTSTGGVQAVLGGANLVLNDSAYTTVIGQLFDILHFTTLNGPTFSGNFYYGGMELFNDEYFVDANGRWYEIHYGDVRGFGNDVVLEAVPEPGSLMLFGLGALGLMTLLRRRSRTKRPE